MHSHLDPRQSEHSERVEIRRYVSRLVLIIALGAAVMVSIGLYLYQRLAAERGETTRRIPVVKRVDADGKVIYLPADRTPRADGATSAPEER